eukprot:gene20647-27435_t
MADVPMTKASSKQNLPMPSALLQPEHSASALPSPQAVLESLGGGSKRGCTSGVLSFDRVAPCLLPEMEQTLDWLGQTTSSAATPTMGGSARGPQSARGQGGSARNYCPPCATALTPSGGAPGEGSPGFSYSSSLQRLFQQQLVFVKKKAGALSYAHDPSGVRSLLSRAFNHTPLEQCEDDADGTGGGDGGQPAAGGVDANSDDAASAPASFDIVHLCATFSVDPLVMGFAQHVKALSLLLRGGDAARHGSRRGSHSQAFQRGCEEQRQVDSFLAFCHSSLYECITQEKAGTLLWYLQLYCLVHGLTAAGGTEGGAGAGELSPPLAAAHLFPGVTASTSSTLVLRGLQMARAYLNSPVGAAPCDTGGPGGPVSSSDQQLWSPLLDPVFVDSLWLLVEQSWKSAGFIPLPGGGGGSGQFQVPHMDGTTDSAIRLYIRHGSIPDCATLSDLARSVTVCRPSTQRGGADSAGTPSSQTSAYVLPVPRSLRPGDGSTEFWLQSYFGTYLLLNSFPTADQVAWAKTALQKSPTFQKLLASVQQPTASPVSAIAGHLKRAVLVPLLRTVLPESPANTLQCLAEHVL